MTPPANVDLPAFDADGHVLEPLAAWSALPDRYRPVVQTDRRGLDHVTVGGEEVFVARLGTMGLPGTDVSRERDPVPLEAALAGAFEPHARLQDLDREGIEAAVLYPTIGLGFWGLRDPRAAIALAQAYNDWLAGFCAPAPDRLLPAAMVPFQDVGAAVHELRRARDLGAVAAFIRPNPCAGRSIAALENDTFWRVAEELGVAIAIHEGLQLAVPPLGVDRRPTNALVLHAVSHTLEQMLACAQLIGTGVLDRHAGLRVVFLEAGGGWVPYWLERLDHHVGCYGGYAPEMRLTPSEYFARQCWVSFEGDERTLPLLAPAVGTDRIVWGSDYPHADSTFPGAAADLRASIASLDREDQASILRANARALYGLA
jgi:predicted TIM-barrel fold metal-dependent hydrolase